MLFACLIPGLESLVVVRVAVLQVFALNVPAAVVRPRELHTVLVHAPADAPFATAGRLALFAFEEAFPVTVGQVQRQSHHPRRVLHALDDSVQFPPTRTKLGLVLVDGQGGVVQRRAHGPLLPQLPLLLFAESVDLFAVDDVFGKERDFGRLQLLRDLRSDGILGLPQLSLWRWRRRFVALLVGAHSSAVEQRVQGLLLAAAGETAESLGARARVDAARLALGERAREAAAAAGLLHELAAHWHRRAHGQRLFVTRLAWHVGAEEGARELQGQEEGSAEQHGPGSRVEEERGALLAQCR